MAIGERMRFLRNLRGMTQKYLGLQVGYSERTADIRIAQYESGSRAPKADTIETVAHILNVSPMALTVPDIDSDLGLMHTLFTLEDRYGLTIGELDGEICLRLDKTDANLQLKMFQMLSPWKHQAEKLKNGEITKEEYDQWRYNYPDLEAAQHLDLR